MAPAQLRFWSLCTGESRVTLRTPDCLADRQVPIDAARRYTIVVSRREDRPANAVAAVRRRLAGLGRARRRRGPDRLRLPDHAQHARSPGLRAGDPARPASRRRAGDDGPVLPAQPYTSKAAFEQRGCAARRPRPAPRRGAAGRAWRARARGTRLRRVVVYAGRRRIAVGARPRRATTRPDRAAPRRPHACASCSRPRMGGRSGRFAAHRAAGRAKSPSKNRRAGDFFDGLLALLLPASSSRRCRGTSST